MSGTSQATPLVAGTIALYAEALGGEASAEDGKQAMYNAMLPRAISPSRALNGSAVESCPSNADLLQTPRLAAELDTSDFDPAAGCKLAVERLAKFQNGSEPTVTCDVGPTPEPLNAEYEARVELACHDVCSSFDQELLAPRTIHFVSRGKKRPGGSQVQLHVVQRRSARQDLPHVQVRQRDD